MINNLQYLRAFAAINVVFFHILLTSAAYDYSPDIFVFLSGWGENGVDIFFVLSGFVMLHTQLHNKRDPISFMKSRIFRVVPIYWLATVTVAISYLIIPESAFNSNSPSFAALLQSLFFIRGAVTGYLPILPVGWTLEWEMLFYIIFSISLLFSNFKYIYTSIFMMLFISTLISRNIIVLEFIFGMLIAHFYHRHPNHHFLGKPLTIMGCLGLIASIPIDFDKEIFRVMIWGIPSALIVMGAVYIQQFNSPIFKLLGSASYSIYIIHFPIVSLYYKINSSINNNIGENLLAVILLLICIIIGSILYLFIEKPILNFFSKYK